MVFRACRGLEITLKQCLYGDSIFSGEIKAQQSNECIDKHLRLQVMTLKLRPKLTSPE